MASDTAKTRAGHDGSGTARFRRAAPGAADGNAAPGADAEAAARRDGRPATDEARICAIVGGIAAVECLLLLAWLAG